MIVFPHHRPPNFGKRRTPNKLSLEKGLLLLNFDWSPSWYYIEGLWFKPSLSQVGEETLFTLLGQLATILPLRELEIAGIEFRVKSDTDFRVLGVLKDIGGFLKGM